MLIITLTTSCTPSSPSPRAKRIIQPYKRLLAEAPPQWRREFIRSLKEGLKISEEEHQDALKEILEAFENYHQGDQNRGALIILSDEDFKDYKSRGFHRFQDILSFMRNTKERANLYVSRIKALMIEYIKLKGKDKILYYFCIDYGANGLREGEEDYFYASEFHKGRELQLLSEWNFEFDTKAERPKDLMRRDMAQSKYKIMVHRIRKMLKNRTDLGHLIVIYTLKDFHPSGAEGLI